MDRSRQLRYAVAEQIIDECRDTMGGVDEFCILEEIVKLITKIEYLTNEKTKQKED